MRARTADERLAALFAAATRDVPADGLALVAVGGYGRSELSPASDLDVVLLHAAEVADDVVEQVAGAIWYPLWDDGVSLDHSVRDVVAMRETAGVDDRAAMGMLDARLVAGDEPLVSGLRSHVLADWRRDARRRVAEVRATRDARIERAGSLAHAAMPDLKESAGGLRDGVVLRALVATWLIDVPQAEIEALRHDLLDVRDALHGVTGRRTERLDPALVPDVAAALDMGPVDLDLHVRDLGRRMEHLTSLAWRRIDDALAPPRRDRITSRGPRTTPLADGVALLGHEVIVTRDADPATDPEVALRAAAIAARSGRRLEPSTAARLARTLGDLPDPWPPSAHRRLVDLLTAGPDMIPVWEALDIAGVIDRWLPEWAEIRLRGSSSPVHRHTIDRHSLDTAVNAAGSVREVARPDVLAVAALLHDIGKGRAGDHSEIGQPMAVRIATRWGFAADDAELIGRLVRHHLLLPNIATRHDIEDPATAAAVAEQVGDVETLELLVALTVADARATSAQAWTSWRRGLVDGLVRKTRAVLDDSIVTPDPRDYEGWPDHVPLPDLSALPAGDLSVTSQSPHPDPHGDGSLLTIVTADRHGLMAILAGGLALAGLSVRSARTVTIGESTASLWEVTRPDVDPAVITPRLRSALAGELDLAVRLDRSEVDDAPRVQVLDSRTETATVILVRARDRRGLLWAICRAIADAGLSIRSAHLTTYGDEARDVFYVIGPDGGQLAADVAAALVGSIASALT